jgi:hypothetical protein
VEKLMSLFDENKSDADEPEEPNPTDYTGVIILAILFPVLFFFRHIGKTDTGLNVAVCLGMCLVAIRIRWDLKTQLWFWGVIAFVLALHVPLFLMVQWPHAWVPGLALLPIGLADVLIILGAVRFVEKFIVKSLPSDEEQ